MILFDQLALINKCICLIEDLRLFFLLNIFCVSNLTYILLFIFVAFFYQYISWINITSKFNLDFSFIGVIPFY
jgi:hypothetical protein